MKKIYIAWMFLVLGIAVSGCGKKDETSDVAITEKVAISEESDSSMEEAKGDTDAVDETDSKNMDGEDTEETSNQVSDKTVCLEGLNVSWADGRKTDLSDYEEVEIVSEKYTTGILFEASDYVSDFRLYELKMIDVSADGKPKFSRNKVYGPKEILPDRPLVLNVSFPGDMSAYGFSYSCNGIDRVYSIMVSGKDGSLVVDIMDIGYPDDNVTIPFTKDAKYYPANYSDIAAKGTMSEDDIDRCLEGVHDMMLHYQGESDDEDYETVGEYNVSQEFYEDDHYGTRVTHTIIWSESELLDPVMNKVGYKEYEVNYIYPLGMWIDENDYEVKPVYASLYIDGNGYEYYFMNDELIMRNGPEGISYNPKTNDFINSIYKVGCYYGNTLLGERDRYSVTISSLDSIEKTDNSFILTGQIWGRITTGLFVIDEDTVFDESCEGYGFEGLKDDESFYSWYQRVYDASINQEEWVDFSTLLGIWDFKTTNGHVDSVCGTYWWD